MVKIEKIRQEIERLIEMNKTKNGFPAGTICAVRIEAYEHLLTFLDTLSEEPDKSLEEEISRTYHDGSVTDTEDIDHVAYENIAHHFAEWQASQMPMPEDTVLFNKGVQEGRRLEREDMLKDAVEGEARVGYPFSKPFIDIEQSSAQWCNMMKKFMNGDKVRIIIVKED